MWVARDTRSKLRAVIEHYTDVPVLGAVAEDPRLAMTERHLGLMPTAEVDDARARVNAIGALVAAQVDLAQVRALAASAGRRHRSRRRRRRSRRQDSATCASASRATAPSASTTRTTSPHCEAAGAELVFIDTLHDTRLPALDGLFIGGGFPEACTEALEANAALRDALRLAIEAGLPTYAECGGLMYLSRSISWHGRTRGDGRRHPGRCRDARRGRSGAATCDCARPPRCPGPAGAATVARP